MVWCLAEEAAIPAHLLGASDFHYSTRSYAAAVGWVESHETHQACDPLAGLVELDPPYFFATWPKNHRQPNL